MKHVSVPTMMFIIYCLLVLFSIELNGFRTLSFKYHILHNIIAESRSISKTSLSPTSSVSYKNDASTVEGNDAFNEVDSVHLKLTKLYNSSEVMNDDKTVESIPKDAPVTADATKSSTIITLNEYVNVTDNSTIIGAVEGISFHELSQLSMHLFNQNYSIKHGILSRQTQIDLNLTVHLNTIKSLWKQEKLLVRSKDFPYNIISASKSDDNSRHKNNMDDKTDHSRSIEKFNRTMHSHVNRMKRLKDDFSNTDHLIDSFLVSNYHSIANTSTASYATTTATANSAPDDSIPSSCMDILNTFSYNISLDMSTALDKLKVFAVWFKKEFPYYYDSCDQCSNTHNNTCIGLIYPQSPERLHNASITELYACNKCSTLTRFPRYNAVCKVLETRRGRCGEYSILMLRFLRLLGYKCRWIVDWADHVWVEVRIDDSWIHVDPCESSVNERLLYQGWGKNQTNIFAYSFMPPYVDDVTSMYTTRFNESLVRRTAEGIGADVIKSNIDRAIIELSLLSE